MSEETPKEEPKKEVPVKVRGILDDSSDSSDDVCLQYSHHMKVNCSINVMQIKRPGLWLWLRFFS